MAVVTVALYALTSTVWRLHALNEANQERRLAENALQSICEQVHSVSAAAQSNPAGWARTLSTAFASDGHPGNRFDVPELVSLPGVESIGTIQVVTDEELTDSDLGFPVGMPRDLDGDGVIASADVSATALLLPVVVVLRWKGGSGERELVHAFFELAY